MKSCIFKIYYLIILLSYVTNSLDKINRKTQHLINELVMR